MADLNGLTRVMLTKSAETEAMIAVLRNSIPSATFTDKRTYWQVEARGEIRLDAEDVSDQLGRALTVEDLLVNFATYAGRAEIDGDEIRVTSEFLQLTALDAPDAT
jgi:hypothetical protein